MGTFRVLTFNMQFGQVWDEKDPDTAPIRLDQTIEFLHSCDADIWLLQEVEHAPRVTDALEAPHFNALRQAFPKRFSAFAHPDLGEEQLPFGIGIAIFAREPLFEISQHKLPAPSLTFTFEGKDTRPASRSLLCAKTRVDGKILQLFNTHLQAFFMVGTTSDAFPAQRDLVAKHLAWPTFPTVLGGDLNCIEEEGTVRQFEALGYATAQKSVPTWKRRPYVMDHLFYNQHLQLLRHEVIPTLASDHNAVLAEFAIRELA